MSRPKKFNGVDMSSWSVEAFVDIPVTVYRQNPNTRGGTCNCIFNIIAHNLHIGVHVILLDELYKCVPAVANSWTMSLSNLNAPRTRKSERVSSVKNCSCTGWLVGIGAHRHRIAALPLDSNPKSPGMGSAPSS